MNSTAKQAIRDAIVGALAAYRRPERAPATEPFIVWKRSSANSWTGAVEQRPIWRDALMRDPTELASLAENVREVVSQHYPDHLGMVGTAVGGLHQFDPEHLLRQIVGEFLTRRGSIEEHGETVSELVDAVERYFDQDAVSLSFIAPLVNFRMDDGAPETILLSGITVRRLTDQEVTDLYGGPLFVLGFRERPQFFHEYAFVGEFAEPKCLGDLPGADSAVSAHVLKTLDAAVLGFRTFQKGFIGYNAIHIFPSQFTPALPGRVIRTFGHEYVPFGTYHLQADKVAPLQKHVSHIMGGLDDAMERACARLATAETRLNPRDRLIDAVIGLEAILLVAQSDREQMSLRFALNYSTLYSSLQERQQAFRVARDLYRHRSKLAHGGSIDEKRVPVGDTIFDLSQAADKAVEVLRTVVKRFLPHGRNQPFRQQDFWERAYFVAAAPPP